MDSVSWCCVWLGGRSLALWSWLGVGVLCEPMWLCSSLCKLRVWLWSSSCKLRRAAVALNCAWMCSMVGVVFMWNGCGRCVVESVDSSRMLKTAVVRKLV